MDSPFSHFSRHFDFPEIAHVPALKAFEWVGRGWQDLRQSPMASLGHGFLVTMLMVFATELAYGRPFLFTAMASGFLLAGPLFALCFYEISRAHEAGEATGFGAAFYAWRRNTRSVALFGLILAIIVIAWERVSAILFALLYGGGMPAMETFMEDVFLSGRYPMLVAAFLLVGAVFALFVFCIAVVSLPMMMHRGTDVATAMATSVRAVAANPFATLLWAIVIVVLTAFGFATSLFGMVLVMPVLGHASWHAYRDMVR